jgi:hypothetical protein
MAESEDTFRLRLPFRFDRPDIEGYNQFSGFLASVASRTLSRLQKLLGPHICLDVEPDQAIYLLINLPKEHLIVRNLRFILTGSVSDKWPLHYADYRVPLVILEQASSVLQQEFVIGFADIAGNIRPSNRDQSNYHRVFLDVLNENWYLPVDMCRLLQDKLGIPVSHILWGHPNLRDPQAKQQKGVFREHQIRIYAEDFLKAGFYISHKQEILIKLANENRRLGKRESAPCPGYTTRRSRPKKPHLLECAPGLPDAIRGKHFDVYWQICKALNCSKAQQGPPAPLLEIAADTTEEM